MYKTILLLFTLFLVACSFEQKTTEQSCKWLYNIKAETYYEECK